MSDLIVELFGLAIIIAASPIVLIPMVVLLGSRSTATAGAYLAAVAAGTGATVGTFLLLADLIDRSSAPSAVAAWLRIVVGTALILVALRQWLTRERRAERPAWLTRLGTATPRTAARVGLLVSLANPKVVGVAAAAGVLIAAEGLPVGRQVLAATVFVVASSASIAVTLLARLLGGSAGESAVQRLGSWLDQHRTALSVAVLAVLGMLLLLDGIARLAD